MKDSTILSIQEHLKKKRHLFAGESSCRKSAVAVPLVLLEGQYHVLFEVRSLTLKSQPGDICFPGGRIEGSERPESTMCREVMEELGIYIEETDILCELPMYHSSNQMIHPYAVLLNEYPVNISNAEVDHIFSIPLHDLLQMTPEVYPIKRAPQFSDDFPYHKVHGGKNYKWSIRTDLMYFYDYGDYHIWGISAFILHEFLEMLRDFALDSLVPKC